MAVYNMHFSLQYTLYNYYFVENDIFCLRKRHVTKRFVTVAVSGNTQLGMVMWHWRPELGPGPGQHHITSQCQVRHILVPPYPLEFDNFD